MSLEEQLTTCFNSLVLDDNSKWYVGKYTNLEEQPPAKCLFLDGISSTEESTFQFIVHDDGMYFADIYYVKDRTSHRVYDILDYELVELVGLELIRKIFPKRLIKIAAENIESITIVKDTATFKTAAASFPVKFEGYFRTANDYTLEFDAASSTYSVSEYTQSFNK